MKTCLNCGNPLRGSQTKYCDAKCQAEYAHKEFISLCVLFKFVCIVVKELLGASYRPEDSENNASDDIANLASFIQRNAKSSLAKQLTD